MIQRLLGVTAAAALFVDAYIHFHDAHLYDDVTSSVLSQGTLFRAEAAVAAALGVALLVWPRRSAFAAALLVLASAFGAVMLYRYVDVGTLGPLPNMYEPTWASPGKLTAAWAEGAGVAVAALGLVVSVHTRRAQVAPHAQAAPSDERRGSSVDTYARQC